MRGAGRVATVETQRRVRSTTDWFNHGAESNGLAKRNRERYAELSRRSENFPTVRGCVWEDACVKFER